MKKIISLVATVICIVTVVTVLFDGGLLDDIFSGNKLENYTSSIIMPEGLVFVGEANGKKNSSGAEVSGKIKNTLPIPATVTITAAFYDKNYSVICYASDTVSWLSSDAVESFTISAETEEAYGFMITSAKIN